MNKFNTQIFIGINLIIIMVIVEENSKGDLFRSNDDEFSLVSINYHTHLGGVDMKSLNLLV